MYDIVIFGATGYTGSLCASFIAKNFPSNINWCIAGRSETRLLKLAKELELLNPNRLEPDVEVVDLRANSLEPLVERARVVINGVGPFHLFSTPIVEACAKVGTDYVDFTTETLWIKELNDRYHTMAKRSGSILIPGISLTAPSDILAWLIAKQARSSFSTGVSEIICAGKLDIKAMSSGSFTTVVESLATYGSWWYLFGNSWILSAAPKSIPKPPWMTRLFGYRYIHELGTLTTSFTGPGNESMVHRSASQNPDLYGQDFHYEEYLPVAGLSSAILVHVLTKLGLILLSIPLLRTLLKKFAAPADSMPDIKGLNHVERAEFHAIGKVHGDRDRHRLWARFRRDGALYEFTALLTCVGAKILLARRLEHEKTGKEVRGQGGLRTPSSLEKAYVDGLQEAGVKIEAGVVE